MLKSFLAIPIKGLDGNVVGVMGVANRPNGYNSKVVDFLSPFVAFYGVLIEKYRAEEALRESQKALLKSENQKKAILDGITTNLALVDKNLKIIWANKASAESVGTSPEEMVGHKCHEFWADPEKPCKGCPSLLAWKTGKAEHALMHTPDGRVWDERGEPVFDQKNKMIGIIAIAYDVTDRIRLKKQLLQAQKMESIGNLAGGIAHDFNNILSSIIGFTELALDETQKGTVLEDSLQEVYSAGKRAKDLVKQILAFARQSDEKRRPIQPGTVAKEVLQLIRSTIPTSIEIRQDINSDSWIFGNVTQLHQVLMNLCTNAAQAMEKLGGVLNVRLKDVFIDKDELSIGMKSGDYVEIKVSDTGAGIAPEFIESIFEPYFTTKGPGKGTGMGLAMVKGLVESYIGKITVDSQLGKGATFTLYLPITKKRSTQGEYVPEQLPQGTERILFVEDEAPIAKMGSHMLEGLGYQVTTRTSSVEALELFRAKPDEFDIVITDMTMPNMTGDNLAVELMKIRPDIPVILCTGYSKEISSETASEIGIKAFAYKPVVKADLAKTIRKVLDKSNG